MLGTTIKISRLVLSLHNNKNDDNNNNDDTYRLIRAALLIISLGLHIASAMIVSLFKETIWEVRFLELSVSVLRKRSYVTDPRRTLICLTPEGEGAAILRNIGSRSHINTMPESSASSQ